MSDFGHGIVGAGPRATMASTQCHSSHATGTKHRISSDAQPYAQTWDSAGIRTGGQLSTDLLSVFRYSAARPSRGCGGIVCGRRMIFSPTQVKPNSEFIVGQDFILLPICNRPTRAEFKLRRIGFRIQSCTTNIEARRYDLL